MTKIKNTKKGMAKKTLSISLAVAMLATSNVPVWAAEFTDGTDAAFTSEAPAEVVDEAPVVEETVENVPEATAADSVYDVTFETETGKFETNMEWGKLYKITVNVTEKNGNALPEAKLQTRWVDEKGLDKGFGNEDITGNSTVRPIQLKKDNVGEVYKLQVVEVVGGKISKIVATSDAITVSKRVLTGTLSEFEDGVEYTGYQIKEVPAFNKNKISFRHEGNEELVNTEDVEIENFVAVAGDTINSDQYTQPEDMKTVKAEGNIVSKYYTGKVTGEFKIWRKIITKAEDAIKVDLPKYVYPYTGDFIEVKADKLTAIERITGNVVEGAIAEDFEIGKKCEIKNDIKKPTVKKVGKFLNYYMNNWDSPNTTIKVSVDDEFKIVPRDLADASLTNITIDSITQDELADSNVVTVANVKNALTISDTDNANLVNTAISNDLFDISIKEDTDGDGKVKVQNGDTLTAVIKATKEEKDNITGSREVSFKVIAHDLSKAEFTDKNKFDAFMEEANNSVYNGEQFTFGLNKDNFFEKLGNLKMTNASKNLVAGTDYDVNVEFGENVNAGKGQIIINGLGDYTGTRKVIEFTINQRPVKASDIVVPKKVLYNPAIREAEEYDVPTSIVVKFKENKKDYELTVPTADYTVARIFENENKVGDYVVTTATVVNTKGNFKFVNDNTTVNTLSAKSTIAYKAIEEADVILEKTEYKYAAKPIIPEYKVVVDGVTLEKGKDYTEEVIHNTDVGEATLTITGKGEYDKTSSVSKKFNIVAADISDLKVVGVAEYNGKQHLSTAEDIKVMLGDKEITGDLLSKNLTVLFPTNKTANINAGDATVTLKPSKTTKNFVGQKEFTFTIAPAKLDLGGTLTAYDKLGTKVDINKAVEYNGKAHTFATTKYSRTVNSPMKFTVNDFDIIYRDNIVGKADSKENNKQYGAVLVVAKGNYSGLEKNDYKCADGEVIKNVIKVEKFQINQIDITKGEHCEVVVENGEYSEGRNVDPVVTVTYKGQKLVKDVDYKLDYANHTNQDRTNVTNGKTLKVDIKAIGGYVGTIKDKVWAIDKFNLANAETIVKGTDAEPIVKLLNKGVVIDPSEYDLVAKDGKATATAKKDSKNYTGEITFDIKEALVKPETPVITDVQVSGNKAKVILSGECEGADGYDYVISKNRNCIVDKDYAKVNKNKLNTDTTFQYIEPQGMYYAYCHAWTRNPETGKKEFSEWSEPYAFSVTAITPSQPVVTSVKVSGSTVTVTYTQSANAQGYDVVLGSKVATVLDEKRPVDYGTLVKKNVSGNTVKVTFKNVKKGTYYAGLHAFNRSASEDNKKVFSPWSNTKKVVVK